jgi:hypothetical protein
MIFMTQDQYGQARGPGYVVRDDTVPDDETEEFPTGQSKPMTRFQEVASALRGGDAVQDEQDQAVTGQADVDPGTAAMANSPISREDHPQGDYADHTATQPDIFGTTTHAGNGASAVTGGPVTGGPVTGGPATGGPATGGPATGGPATGGPATGGPAGGVAASDVTGTAGRHAAAVPADAESRPGKAAGTMGDFSDLTYGNLIPDAAQYTEQWRHVQFKFVDDPHASVTEAADIIAQVTAKLETAIQERQRAIEERQRAIQEQQRSLRGRWGEDTNADTEALRETLRMYRTFLDQLIGPRAS